MTKIDLSKELEDVYTAKRKPKLVTVPEGKFLTILGKGDPNGEGLSAQIMHVGSYSEEIPTINKIHEWVEKQGYRLRGDHHEIYMSDPRKTKPENLKTIIRNPVEKIK